jgi:hypothetical protein
MTHQLKIIDPLNLLTKPHKNAALIHWHTDNCEIQNDYAHS